MKNFSKFIANMAKVVTKIVEVFQWVGAGLMLAATVCALVNPSWVGYFSATMRRSAAEQTCPFMALKFMRLSQTVKLI